jgi:hypothetical protein
LVRLDIPVTVLNNEAEGEEQLREQVERPYQAHFSASLGVSA